MKTAFIVFFLLFGVTMAAELHDAHVWHQIEQQALVTDLAEGAQR